MFEHYPHDDNDRPLNLPALIACFVLGMAIWFFAIYGVGAFFGGE